MAYREPMATYPPADGSRCLSIDLAAELVEHLDAQARYYGCARVAYLRRLIIDDMTRQGKASRRQAARNAR